ncbi:putative ribonuclease H-like domain-containing protein [Tanacetum coccineum]
MRFSPRGQTDAQRAALWHVISDMQGENWDLWLQLAEERCTQLELAKVIDGVSTEDANQKFLRSLPSAWSQVSLIMMTKPGVDSLSFVDMYYILESLSSDVKGSTASSSRMKNVAFVSENTSSTNDVSTAYGVSNSSSHNSQYEHPSSYSLLANQSSGNTIGFMEEERLGIQEDSKALVTLDGEGVDWTSHSEDEQENYALWLAAREQLGDASIEIQAYTQALKKRIYIPSGPDKEIDDSQFTYGPKQSKPSESDARRSDFNTCESNCSEETHESMPELVVNEPKVDYPQRALHNKGIVDQWCFRIMMETRPTLLNIKTLMVALLLLEEVKMCDKKNKVLFTDTECLVLSPEFKLPDENQVLLRIPRQNNMYSFNLENIVPSGGLACLIAKATINESNKWHRRLGHVNFKNLNKLVKGNLVRGLPSKIFQNDHTCVACQKGKQHKASCPKEDNHSVGTEDNIDVGNSEIEVESAQGYFILPLWSSYTSTVKSSKAKNVGKEPNKNPDLKTDDKLVDKEDQVFLDELERLKRQEHDVDDAVEALRKEFAKDTKDLLLQAGAAKASNDSEIPALEDMYDHPTDGIFTNASYDDEGAVVDFTNLETIVNVSPIPTSRINSIHLSTSNYGDQSELNKAQSGPKVMEPCFCAKDTHDDNVANLLTMAFDLNKSYSWGLSGCSSHMTGNKAYLLDYEDYNRGFVAFRSDPKGDFHEIIDFLTRSSIHYALIVSPIVSTTFVEQFWMFAKSKIINNVRYITAKVAGKPVNISEASIRSDLLFDDADGIYSLHNQAIFDAI